MNWRIFEVNEGVERGGNVLLHDAEIVPVLPDVVLHSVLVLQGAQDRVAHRRRAHVADGPLTHLIKCLAQPLARGAVIVMSHVLDAVAHQAVEVKAVYHQRSRLAD